MARLSSSPPSASFAPYRNNVHWSITWWGGIRSFLLGRDTARGSRHATGYLAAQLPAFVRPTYDYDRYRPEQNEYSALDRNRVLWRVTVADGRPLFRDGLAFVHDYRFFFAFDALCPRKVTTVATAVIPPTTVVRVAVPAAAAAWLSPDSVRGSRPPTHSASEW